MKPPVAARNPKVAISTSFAWTVEPLVATVGVALLPEAPFMRSTELGATSPLQFDRMAQLFWPVPPENERVTVSPAKWFLPGVILVS